MASHVLLLCTAFLPQQTLLHLVEGGRCLRRPSLFRPLLLLLLPLVKTRMDARQRTGGEGVWRVLGDAHARARHFGGRACATLADAVVARLAEQRAQNAGL